MSTEELNIKMRAAAQESMVEKRPPADRYIVGFYIVLCLISVVELYSASSREVTSANIFGPLIRQSVMLIVGIILCVWISRMKLNTIIVIIPWFVLFSVLAMCYVLVNGQVVNGARRSFSVPGFTVQPAELIKISAVLFIAYVLSKNQEKGGVKTKGVVICTIAVMGFGVLLFTQGLTNTLLLMAISLSMMLIGGIQWRKFALVMLAYGVIGGAGLYVKMHSGGDSAEDTTEIMTTGKDASGKAATIDRSATWGSRFERYFDSTPKWNIPINSKNQQEMYSYMAQAHGGVTGVLPGNSRETSRLPLAFSDYIFSIVVEDWGFIGGVALLGIYLSLLGRAGVIAFGCDRVFPAMLVIGMAVLIVFQALFHMAIVTGVFPVSGQPLPMISQGGTSMIVTSIAFGIMLSISRYAAMSTNVKSNPNPEELPAELNAINPSKETV